MLRPLHIPDVAQVTSLHGLCFEQGWPQADFIGHLQDDIGLGYFTVQGLMGFILLRVVLDEVEILTFAVHPDVQGQGYGGALLDGALIRMQISGARHLFLEVAEDNMRAYWLYRRFGLTELSRRQGYYKRRRGRVAAIHLVKQL